jgi:hypothetical protein
MKFNVLELFLCHVGDQYLFPLTKLVYPYIFWRLAAYEKFMGLVGEAYSKQGVSSDHCAIDTLPSLASVTVRVQIH